LSNCGLRNGEPIKTGFHYEIDRYTWYRQEDDHWVELSECAYVKRFETWLLVEEDCSETDVGEAGVRAALRRASEVLEQKRFVRDTELNARVRYSRKAHALTGEIVCGECGGVGLHSCVCGLSRNLSEGGK
jgi:hypothetical protein